MLPHRRPRPRPSAAADPRHHELVGELGGGIAIQMAYQFPERVERLVLVSSGGLGRQVRVGADIAAMATGFASLQDIEARRAFVHTARSVIDLAGQRVSATDKLHLAEAVPKLILWGDRDSIIPARHGIRAHELMPGSRLRIFGGCGHFPPTTIAPASPPR